MAMSILTCGILLSTFTLSCAEAFAAVAGYTPVTNISEFLAIGSAIKAVDTAVSFSESKEADWALATTEYEKEQGVALSLRKITTPPAGGDDRFKIFSAYYGSDDYMHSFVDAALKGTGNFNLNDKARQELIMKGIVLQGVLMASMSHLHKAVNECSVGSASALSTQFLDQAWALYACSESKGPIKLAEKRAPQFDTQTTPFSEAGQSKVNTQLLAHFKDLQSYAQEGRCDDMQSTAKQVMAQMMVPVIQGMLREAFEVDPKETETHRGADGFIEVVEGWAFARAVLPAINACSSQAAEIITRNMDTIHLGENGQHLPDGYKAVKAAVESTYLCLGISCSDVNAMVNPFKTGQLLWEPCKDEDLGQSDSTSGEPVDGAQTADVDGSPLKASLSAVIAICAMLVHVLKIL
mmetsp:Transcript_89066/g.157660  ORF Transcript_89066/g.157660 Transcript_89066/m.157660 type:complete len:409 (-) Transcript_89066:46-1272(-)